MQVGILKAQVSHRVLSSNWMRLLHDRFMCLCLDMSVYFRIVGFMGSWVHVSMCLCMYAFGHTSIHMHSRNVCSSILRIIEL